MEVWHQPLQPAIKQALSSHLEIAVPDFPGTALYMLKPGCPSPGWPSLLRHPNRSNQRYRNINLFPISYTFRSHFRGRLTLRRLTLHRNPWAFGERAFHPLYRYSCQHSHFRYLQPASRQTFIGLRNAPLPCALYASAASVNGLSPVKSSTQADSTSELLRFLSRMAASKPTSWLSRRLQILSHLAQIWGP